MRHESIVGQIRRDFEACLARDPAARTRLEVLLCYPGLHAIAAYRIFHLLHGWGFPLLARRLSHITRAHTGIEIHPAAEIESGVFIDHGMGVVIGETAEIGHDCTLYQGVTLGGTTLQHGKRHPTLEDGVIVGAGATVLGAIVIGQQTKIAAGAVVVGSVPPNSTVVGVPGRVVYKDGKKVAEPVIPRVEMPDPNADAVAALARRIESLEEQVRELERRHGTASL
ncbi:MAG: serine O-acetyltransferase [Candidatus Eremiobacteraeota bacterium]|nr:serine O-acetyltransferase [Candidatus Eremiobacteraeota bacterium]MBC5826491.1 serine O-acetyltransferase [Candidatus Eremiobacteraeota bacterium]